MSQLSNEAVEELKGGVPALVELLSPGGMKFSPVVKKVSVWDSGLDEGGYAPS